MQRNQQPEDLAGETRTSKQSRITGPLLGGIQENIGGFEMSSFNCETCHRCCTDTEFGLVTGCEHHPADRKAVEKYLLKQLCLLDNSLPFLAGVSADNGHFTAEPLKRWAADLKTTIGIMLGGK